MASRYRAGDKLSTTEGSALRTVLLGRAWCSIGIRWDAGISILRPIETWLRQVIRAESTFSLLSCLDHEVPFRNSMLLEV